MTRIATIGICLSLLLVFSAGTVGADLLSEHFGVTLALDFAHPHTDYYQGQTSYAFLASSFTPSLNASTTDYVVNDWSGSWSTNSTSTKPFSNWSTGTTPSGGELYDIEAIYFDDDPYNLYIAVVASFPGAPGLVDGRLSGDPLIVAGDLALNLGLNSAASDGFRYDYGVNLNPENRRSGENATSGGSTVGGGLYRTANGDWYLGSPENDISGNARTNIDPEWSSFAGGYLGEASVDYYQYHFFNGSTEVYETLAPTYIFEVRLDRTLLAALDVGDTLAVQYTMGCRNDVLRLSADVDANAIPEPGTLALLGLGVAGLGARLRRRARGLGAK